MYGLDGFVSFHDSAEAAKAAAQDDLDNANDGEWNEDVENVCWGKVEQEAVMVNKRPDPDGRYDYLCDCELHDVAYENQLRKNH